MKAVFDLSNLDLSDLGALRSELKSIIKECLQECLPAQSQSVTESEPEFIGAAKACEILGIKPQTLYGLTHRQQVPHYKTGKKLRFKKDELLKYLEDGRRSTSKENAALAETNMIAANTGG